MIYIAQLSTAYLKKCDGYFFYWFQNDVAVCSRSRVFVNEDYIFFELLTEGWGQTYFVKTSEPPTRMLQICNIVHMYFLNQQQILSEFKFIYMSICLCNI